MPPDIGEAGPSHLFLYADNSFRIAAQQNPPPAYAERWRQRPVLAVGDNPRNPLDRLVATRRVVNTTDLMAEPAYIEREPRFVALVESAGARSHLAVPMLKAGKLVGAISSTGRRYARSPISRSIWLRTSPRKPSSPSRTRGCSKSYASAPTISPSRWNSKPRLPRF